MDNLEDETLALKTSLLWKSIKHLGCKDLSFKEPERAEEEDEETGVVFTSLEMEAMGWERERERGLGEIGFLLWFHDIYEDEEEEEERVGV